MPLIHLDKYRQQRLRPPFSGTDRALETAARWLVPVKRVDDVEAVLSHLLALDRCGDVHFTILHVIATSEAMSTPAYPGYAEVLVEQVESRCRADSIAHESYILAGDPVFSILDAAEFLACDAIVLPVLKTRPWHCFFLKKIARKMQRLRRDVPLVFVTGDGAVIRSVGA